MRRPIGHLFLALCTMIAAPAARASFVTFESGQVRPLALSPDGTRLFAVAVDTPDDRLEIFAVGAGVVKIGSVRVGLEPVVGAARSDTAGYFQAQPKSPPPSSGP